MEYLVREIFIYLLYVTKNFTRFNFWANTADEMEKKIGQMQCNWDVFCASFPTGYNLSADLIELVSFRSVAGWRWMRICIMARETLIYCWWFRQVGHMWIRFFEVLARCDWRLSLGERARHALTELLVDTWGVSRLWKPICLVVWLWRIESRAVVQIVFHLPLAFLFHQKCISRSMGFLFPNLW